MCMLNMDWDKRVHETETIESGKLSVAASQQKQSCALLLQNEDWGPECIQNRDMGQECI